MARRPKLFNDLLTEAGISPVDVRLLRHHTQPGSNGRSLYDLWREDRSGFERYQSTQTSGRPIFRTGKIWAAFVSPEPGSALFVGLYDAEYSETRVADWICSYGGDVPGDRKPVDHFRTALRPELGEHIGRLRIAWDLAAVRPWARYAADARFPILADKAAGARGIPLVRNREELERNLRHLEAIRSDPEHPEREEYIGYIKRGTCFLPYRTGEGVGFAPSRLLGYKDNDFRRHVANEVKHGSNTNAALSALLGGEPRASNASERSYRAFCRSLGFEPSAAGRFGHPRKYWSTLALDRPPEVPRATPQTRRFRVGGLYSRDEVAELIGLPAKQRKGAWTTGYSRFAGEFFVFANVGTSGRTGHDYPNRWEGRHFVWFGKSGTEVGQPEMRDLLGGDFPVHIFWRGDDRAAFAYAGLGVPLEASGAKPVQVRWTFDELDVPDLALPQRLRWRRGPPPVSGPQTRTREDGPTSVYLLVLEGPVGAAFPNLDADTSIVKVGMSNDVRRRLDELSCGLPPGCTLRWRVVAERELASGSEAYAVETALLERLRIEGKWIGGEFARVPNAELKKLASLT